MGKFLKIFRLTSGNVSYTPGSNWTNFVGAQGTADLQKGRTYKWELIINGQYTNNTCAMNFRINLTNENGVNVGYLPDSNGMKKYFHTNTNWGIDLTESDVFLVNNNGKHMFQVQIQEPNGYNYQWNSAYGAAQLIVELWQ